MTIQPMHRVANTPRAASKLQRAKRVLVCLRYGIGDVVMQLPMLHALRRAALKAHITAVGAAPAIELLEGAGLADEIVPYGRWGIRHLWDSGAEGTPTQIAGWLEEAAFELVLAGAYAPQAIHSEAVIAALRQVLRQVAVAASTRTGSGH